MKLQGLENDIVIHSTTHEEWATVQDIFLMNGFKHWGIGNKCFENDPYTCGWPNINEFMNSSEDVCVIDGDTIIPASTFIASNTNLADTSTNQNEPSTHSANA